MIPQLSQVSKLYKVDSSVNKKQSNKVIRTMDNNETYQSYNDINSDNDIVISGIAGRFANSDNIKQLQENLFQKMNLVRDIHYRWKTSN